MKALRDDEQAWMNARLETGRVARERRGDPAYLEERRRQRSDLAAQRYAKRRANAQVALRRRPPVQTDQAADDGTMAVVDRRREMVRPEVKHED